MVDTTYENINFPPSCGFKSGYNDDKWKRSIRFLPIEADAELEQADILYKQAKRHNGVARDIVGTNSNRLEGLHREFCAADCGPTSLNAKCWSGSDQND